MKSGKKKSWSSVICWAIGCGYKGKKRMEYKMSGTYQILFDYLARNLKFWRYYSKILRVKYIYFVDNKKVAKISFDKIINIATRYKLLSEDKSLEERRVLADALLKNLKFK